MRLIFVNFDLGVYLLQNGITGLIREAKQYFYYFYLRKLNTL